MKNDASRMLAWHIRSEFKSVIYMPKLNCNSVSFRLGSSSSEEIYFILVFFYQCIFIYLIRSRVLRHQLVRYRIPENVKAIQRDSIMRRYVLFNDESFSIFLEARIKLSVHL